MKPDIRTISIRPFIGCNDYKESIAFYEAIGFQVISIAQNMSVCSIGSCSFYLQDAHIKDWIDNTMLFLEVENPEGFLNHLKSLDLKKQFPSIQLKEMVHPDWGKEFFLHDPSNILWHIGSFKK
ncbi:MAG: glyoxalase [Nonlabens sp.]|uniref:glyoxalase n=1 Tax=Nonlabens sp. TaxID=1888209 RepID=UPI003EFB301D